MADPFTLVVEQMIKLGFYNFVFPFMITAALFYALFRKSKILGESVVINGVVALSIAFLIFGYPVIAGISLATPLATFFTQATVWILILVIGMVFASIFYPDLGKMLLDQFTKRTTLYQMLALAVALFITSGLVVTLIQGASGPPAKPGEVKPPAPPADVVLIASALIIFLVLLMIAASIFRGEG